MFGRLIDYWCGLPGGFLPAEDAMQVNGSDPASMAMAAGFRAWPAPIPVAEQLPPEDPEIAELSVQVLAWRSRQRQWLVARHDLAEGQWVLDGKCLEGVTHWAPLPPAP